LLNPMVRRELSRNARAHIEATFSEPFVLEQIQDMYRKVLNS
jgi:hypothetical protein